MKTILIVLLVGINYSIAVAQNVNFGIKGGLNLSSLTGDVSDLDSRTSFHFGAIAEIEISETFSIQPEVLFSSQGAKDSQFDEELRLNYLNLPIMAKYFAASGLSIEAGPQIGVLLSAKSEFDGEEEDVEEAFNDLDLGVNFGLGYKLENGINFALRYTVGISNVLDEGDEFKVRNGVFQLSVGYFFK